MASNWKNYKKKLSDEKKAALKETAAKRKKIVTCVAWTAAIVLVVALITVAIIIGSKGDNKKDPAATTAPATTEHSHVHGTPNTNVTLPKVSKLISVSNDDMEPLFKSGDVVEVESVKEKSELEIGDVIAYVDNVYNGKKLYKVLRISDILENEGSVFYEVKADKKTEPENEVIAFESVVGKFKEVKDLSQEELKDLLNGSAE
jgi:hypothetical protein